jgi:hypothetical protein
MIQSKHCVGIRFDSLHINPLVLGLALLLLLLSLFLFLLSILLVTSRHRCFRELQPSLFAHGLCIALRVRTNASRVSAAESRRPVPHPHAFGLWSHGVHGWRRNVACGGAASYARSLLLAEIGNRDVLAEVESFGDGL